MAGSGSYEMQQNTWLGDMCDEVRRVVLIEGDTMIIPAGYIHAVVSGNLRKISLY